MNINIGLRQDGYMVPLGGRHSLQPEGSGRSSTVCRKSTHQSGKLCGCSTYFQNIWSIPMKSMRQELQKIHDRFVPFLNICKENHTAIRIGVNHGSSIRPHHVALWRYTGRYGGILYGVSAHLRCKRHFTDVVISIKASNTVVMVKTVRLLVAVMEQEGMRFPLHLGVTEAGDGEDGRIKSALGIGALLADGLGDTIRVSLSEAPEAEIPVARKLVDYIVLAPRPSLYPRSRCCRNSIISLPPAARLRPSAISAETICPWSLPHAWTGTWTSIRSSCRTISIRWTFRARTTSRKAMQCYLSMPMSGWKHSNGRTVNPDNAWPAIKW